MVDPRVPAVCVRTFPGLAEAEKVPGRATFATDVLNWFQEDERSGEQERSRVCSPCSSHANLASRIRSQNSIWRGGFHRRGYREAMRIQPADFRKSRAF